MKITFLGGGNMANAMIGGLVKTGFSASDIAVIELGAQGRARLRLVYGVRCYEAPSAAAFDCDAVLLSVKPQQMREACMPLPNFLKQQLIISIAAGSTATARMRCAVGSWPQRAAYSAAWLQMW